jgi:hypothetical protein
MICIQCGAQNEDSISYCRQCGTNLQAVRSALLGVPPSASQQLQPLINPKLGPIMLILSTVFGFLSFGALFGAVIAIIAIGSEPSSRLGPDAIVFLASLVAVTGAVGIVMLIRTLLKSVTTMSTATAVHPVANAGSRALPNPQPVQSLPPPRQPASVVEHTTAHLPNYVRPNRDTGEQT